MDPSRHCIIIGGGKNFAVDLPAFPNLDQDTPLRVLLTANRPSLSFDLDSPSLLQARGWPVDADCMAEAIRYALEPGVYALPERFAEHREFRDRLAKHFEYFGLPVGDLMTPSERRYVLVQEVTAPAFNAYGFFIPEKRLPEVLSEKQLHDWLSDDSYSIIDLLNEVPWIYKYEGEHEMADMSMLPKGSVVSRMLTSVKAYF